MKKIFIAFILLFFSGSISYAIDEIVLDQEKTSVFDKLSDIYYGKVENKSDVSPILALFSKDGYEYKNSYINSIKATFLYSGHLSYTNTEKDSSLIHSFYAVEPMITIKFNENKSKAMFDINFARKIDDYDNKFTQKISQAYISHNISNNQTILIGQGARLPNSYDGSRSLFSQEMFLKSQLGRTLGEAISVGIRNIASYKYIDYDIGIYDSTRYMKDFGKGIDFTGQIIYKPFTENNEKSGDLKIGGSYNIGKYYNSYNMYSAFLGYKYKKFYIRTEYANADGYNGVRNSKNNADGFYSLIMFNIHPKLDLLTRYDYFIADRNYKSSYCNEYSVGINYHLFSNMKLMLNYVKRNYSDKIDSHMILFATRFIL